MTSDAATTMGGPPPAQGPTSLWRHPNFLKLWSAETVSQFGTAITQLALPLTAILVLKATAFQVGLLTTVEFLPFILVGLPAGVWVDRMRRRPILIVGDLGRALVLGSIPLAYALGGLHIVQLYVCAFVTGILTVFFDVAYMSYLPSLVDRRHLVDGNSKLEISRSAAQLGGPGLAGGLIHLLSAPAAILFDAVSYLWSAAFVFRIRAVEPPVEVHDPNTGRPRMGRQIADGLRFVFGHRLLLPIAICTGTSNLFTSMAQAVLLLFAVRELGLDPGVIGGIFAVGNVGFLLGAFAAQRIARAIGVGRTIIASAILFSVGGLLTPLATRSVAIPFLLGSLLISGFGGVAYNINQVSLRQAITAERMQGRMNATMRFVVWGTMPIGAFLGGVLGTSVGLRPTLWVAGIGGAFAFVSLLFSPIRRVRTIPDSPADDGRPHEPVPAPPFAATDDGLVEPAHLPHPVDERVAPS
jgi:MFS family permease